MKDWDQGHKVFIFGVAAKFSGQITLDACLSGYIDNSLMLVDVDRWREVDDYILAFESFCELVAGE